MSLRRTSFRVLFVVRNHPCSFSSKTVTTLQSHPNSFHTAKPPKQLPHFTKPPKQLPHFKATQTASTLQSHPNSFHTSKSLNTASTLQSHPNSFHTSKSLNTASTLQSHPNSFHTSQSRPTQLPHFKATQTASTLHKAYQRNRRTEHDNK